MEQLSKDQLEKMLREKKEREAYVSNLSSREQEKYNYRKMMVKVGFKELTGDEMTEEQFNEYIYTFEHSDYDDNFNLKTWLKDKNIYFKDNLRGLSISTPAMQEVFNTLPWFDRKKREKFFKDKSEMVIINEKGG